MIARSRAERARSGDIYVVWGVIIIVADLVTTLGPLFGVENAWIAFPIVTPIGVIYSTVAGFRRDLTMSTFGTRIETRLWVLVMAAMAVMTYAGLSGLVELRAIVPLTASALGIAVGTSGVVFDSRMMSVAGGVFMAVAAISVPLPLVAQHLLFVVAMAVGYVAPGLLLMRAERANG